MEQKEDPQRQRFLVELEFVQCLANPHYIEWLATQGYLLDGKFIRYLDYLQYWKEPQYAKFLVYPHCLRFLDLLQHEEIRKLLTEDRTFHLKLLDQQFYHWLYRRRHTQQAKAPEGSGGASAQKPAAAQQPAAGASATGPR